MAEVKVEPILRGCACRGDVRHPRDVNTSEHRMVLSVTFPEHVVSQRAVRDDLAWVYVGVAHDFAGCADRAAPDESGATRRGAVAARGIHQKRRWRRVGCGGRNQVGPILCEGSQRRGAPVVRGCAVV